jgi:hypothetical protein
MDSTCKPSIRPLYAWEITEARRVFGDSLRYTLVRIHECVDWPNTINRVGTRLKGMQYVDVPNAITLGNHCYFPVKLLELPVPVADPQHYKIGWLIHELTHAWQYQRMGWSYLRIALQAQLSEKAHAYDFGGEVGLLASFANGRKLADFNLEQQGDIARTYYEQLVRGGRLVAWQPFIDEIQAA